MNILLEKTSDGNHLTQKTVRRSLNRARLTDCATSAHTPNPEYAIAIPVTPESMALTTLILDWVLKSILLVSWTVLVAESAPMMRLSELTLAMSFRSGCP